MHAMLKRKDIRGSKKQRKKAAKPTRAESQYRLMVESLVEYAFISLDSKGYIQSWNRGAERLLQYKEKEILGKYGGIFFTPEDCAKGIDKKEMASALTRGRAEDERWHVRKDGSRFWGSGLMLPFRSRGKIIGLIKIFRDATKKMEHDKRKDDFVGIASHELRTPLSILKSSIELLLLSPDVAKNSMLLTVHQNMNEQVNRLSLLVNDLLDLSKIESGQLVPKKRPLDLRRLIIDVVASYKTMATSHAIVFRSSMKAMVNADKGQMTQVIYNLLNNAIKYSPNSGRIEIWIDQTPEEVKVSVQDYGIGISIEEKQRIFDRFYRVKNRGDAAAGLGIGLYVCAEIIKMHGGRIDVVSEKGKGSIFFFTMPHKKQNGAKSR
jgi:PAS domain S-box-containing protein